MSYVNVIKLFSCTSYKFDFANCANLMIKILYFYTFYYLILTFYLTSLIFENFDSYIYHVFSPIVHVKGKIIVAEIHKETNIAFPVLLKDMVSYRARTKVRSR